MGRTLPENGYRDKATFEKLYQDKELKLAEIADIFDIGITTAYTWKERHGIETRQRWKSAKQRLQDRKRIHPDTGCWEYTGSSGEGGYGHISVDGDTKLVHRISYEIHNGDIPEGAYICHKCHNPPCFNPDHLYAGDAESNAQDAIDNGDWPELFGERQGNSVLTDDEVVEIRERYANEDVTYADLQEEYGISPPALSNIINGNTWPHVGGPTDTDTDARMVQRGEDTGTSKLTEAEVREIRRVYSEGGFTMAEVGERFGVSSTMVCDIVNRRAWKHVE